MTTIAKSAPMVVFRRITLRGGVQGLGIRPTVAKLANTFNLRGTVRNEMSGVIIQVSGRADVLENFIDELPRRLPAGANVAEVESEGASNHPASFRIVSSVDSGPTRTPVPVDRVVCESCLDEVRSPGNRRFGYPFTSCTRCGPRYSILRSMPYDRQRTSMSSFAMCDLCNKEYQDPSDRRFHSQTNCCPACGPRLWFTEPNINGTVEREEAMQATIEAILEGRIVAIKGVGGYQLVCDATNEAAIGELRRRKQRASKPLAIMAMNIDIAEELAQLSPIEREAICSPSGPIIIARSKPESILAPAVNPGLCDIGVMLPSSPLHAVLIDAVKVPLVVTSGNVDGEPLEYREHEAEPCLADIADHCLHHDREIVRPIDDSVVRCIANRVVTIRAGRGIAPIPLDVKTTTPAIAVGGQQKVAVALSDGHQSVLGPHIGDLDSIASRERFIDQTESICRLYQSEAKVTVRDSHPDYFTSQYDRSRHRESIQHHHAHIVSGMVQHGWLDKTVLGFAFDGTGFGTDGTIWGGEVLVATDHDFDRVGHLRSFSLAGGEAAIRDPSRVAIALVQDTCPTDSNRMLDRAGIDIAQREAIAALLRNSRLSPLTTSVGRLFDGVAAMTLGECRSSYEGEPAMQLEAACDREDIVAYEISLRAGATTQLDWRPMIRQLLDDKRAGISQGKIAMRFHRGLAQAVARIVERFPELPVILSGGVFQNRVLVELIADSIPYNRPIGLPGVIPPGDGGLAVGQLATQSSAGRISVQEPKRTKPCV